MFHTIEAPNGDEAWRKATEWFVPSARAARHKGRGGVTNEILHAAISINNPRDRWVSSRTPAINVAFAVAEVIWIICARRDSAFLNFFNSRLRDFQGDGETFHGAYGYRLRTHFKVDQLKNAAFALLNNPQTRQVVLQIWDPRLDLPRQNGRPRSPDIPCNISSLLKIRQGRLEWTQIMRSNDLFRGLPHNIIQFTTLQEIIAGWLDIEPGSYNHFADSLHWYSADGPIEGHISDPVRYANTESLALSYAASKVAFAKLSDFGDQIIRKAVTPAEIVKDLRRVRLPQAFLNLAVILAAEGLRRRRATQDVNMVLKQCSNPCLRELFERWLFRTGL